LLSFKIVIAQTLERGDLYSVEYLWEEVFGLPAEWMIPRNFIFNFMVPFLALFAVCLGMIRAIGMFRRSPNIEVVLAFSMAFLTLPSKWFIWFVAGSLAFAGGYAYILFLIMFFIGGALYTRTFYLRKLTAKEAAEHYLKTIKKLYTDLNRIDRRLSTIRRQLADPFISDRTRELLMKEAFELRTERQKIIDQLEKMKEAQELV